MTEQLKQISQLISGLKYCEWLRIVKAIEQKYSSAFATTTLGQAEEIEKVIEFELKNY